MGERGEPAITALEEGKGEARSWTKVTFTPDLSLFGLSSLQGTDVLRLMQRRAVDLAGTNQDLRVTLNGDAIDLDFEKYVSLYPVHKEGGAEREEGWIRRRINNRWQLAVGTSEDGHFHHVSFVNSINTPRGGTHVNYIADQLSNAIATKLCRRHRGLNLQVSSKVSSLLMASHSIFN